MSAASTMDYIKYPRTPHLPWSEEPTSDDRILRSVSHFTGKDVVVTEKMDGENTTMYQDHVHARSLDSKGGEDRAWVKQFWASICADIPQGWRICGENLWAKHSISYDNLDSFFYGFSIWNEQNVALSWDETLEWFALLGITPVPTLYRGQWDQPTVVALWDATQRGGKEGYVVRLAEAFSYDNFGQSVAKFVRKGHVQPGKHWRHQALVPNSLAAHMP